MIKYNSKYSGTIEEIERQGFSIWNRDRVWHSSNDIAVQKIIDSFDNLAYLKIEMKKELVIDFNAATKALENSYPEAEKRTFIKQELEARSYLLDSTALTPTLTAISTARNIPLVSVVNRVILKADAYTAQVGALVGLRQSKEDKIDSSTDLNLLEKIVLGV